MYGDEGDDKIWVVNPEQRGLEYGGAEYKTYGGLGNDHIFGSEEPEIIVGDDGVVDLTTDPMKPHLDYGMTATELNDYYN